MDKKIKEIAEILVEHTPTTDYSLLSGFFGEIFYLYWYSLVDNAYAAKADEALERIFKNLSQRDSHIDTYCDGLAGFGIGLHLLQENEFIQGSDNFLADIDSYLGESLSIHFSRLNYDFLHGATGIGFYFLKHYIYAPDISKKQLRRILIFLIDIMIVDHEEQTITWGETFMNRSIGKWQKKINLSLSHGVSSIIILLSKIHQSHIFPKTEFPLEEILHKAIRYVLAHQYDYKQVGFYFPSIVSEDKSIPAYSRLSWCYGDLGTALSLYHAGKALNQKKYVSLALEIFQYIALYRRDLKSNGIHDAILCHGTAGIAQFFFRLSQETNNCVFKDAYVFWKQRTIDMATHINGVAGYQKYNAIYDSWDNEYSLLDGIAGIGLMLLSPINSNWDELLLLSFKS